MIWKKKQFWSRQPPAANRQPQLVPLASNANDELPRSIRRYSRCTGYAIWLISLEMNVHSDCGNHSRRVNPILGSSLHESWNSTLNPEMVASVPCSCPRWLSSAEVRPPSITTFFFCWLAAQTATGTMTPVVQLGQVRCLGCTREVVTQTDGFPSSCWSRCTFYASRWARIQTP